MTTLAPFLARYHDVLWKSVSGDDGDNEPRILEGIASSAAPDLAGDILESKGATYTLPMPLLMHHDRERPVGKVISARVSDSEIAIRCTFAGKSKLDYVEHAWQQLKEGLVTGFSIGAQPLEAEPILSKEGRMTGVRYKSWRWLETSAVTLPMNQKAGIGLVRMLEPWGTNALTRGDPAAGMDPPDEDRGYEETRARALAAMAAARRALYRR